MLEWGNSAHLFPCWTFKVSLGKCLGYNDQLLVVTIWQQWNLDVLMNLNPGRKFLLS